MRTQVRTMYAVIQTGGKQYRVAKDDVIKVEKLAGEAGATVELDQVLMLGNGADTTVGAPLVDGARVVATVLEQKRDAKIIVFKKKRRKNYRRTRGHRQDLTVLRITDVLAAGAKAAKAKAETKTKADVKADEAAAREAKPAAKPKAAAKKAPAKKAAPKAKADAAEKAPKKKAAAKKPAVKKPAAARKKSTEEDS